MVLADAEPEFADDGDCVTWKRQTAVQHRDEGSTPRSTVLFEAPGGEDGPEIHRDLPGVSNAQGGIMARRQFISTLTPGPSSQFQRLDAIVYGQSRADCG